MRVVSCFMLALMCFGCVRVPATTEPVIETALRTRFEPDTTREGFKPGALRQRIVDTYDEHGIVVFSEYRDANDGVQMRFVSTVEDGLKTRTEWRSEDGSLALYVLYRYDDQNRVIETRQYAPDSTFLRGFQSEWSDDGRSRRTGSISETGEPFEPDSFYKLNARGEELELLEFPTIDSLRTLFTYDYPERDVYGNWTIRTTRRDGVPSQIEIRELVYRNVP